MISNELLTAKQRFGIIGNSEALNNALEVAMRVAPTDLSVLVTGESGVGKEFFPQVIHAYSARKHKKYIAVNCGAIPEGTIDSELFGHEKGSFTGAIESRKGYFEEADGGTIFLDEVGELPMATQARLLRVLENGEFLRVGSSKVEKTNVRIVCATNVNLPEAISEGRFREDLYYRLNTVPINVPPLRKRGEDVVLLFKKFALDFAAKYAVPKIQLGESAKSAILEYSWPGNIRQLKNVAEQISLLEMQREITGETMKKYLPQQTQMNLPARLSSPSTKGKTFESEREILYSVLFDMRRDITELKAQVEELTMGRSRKEEMPLYATAHEISMPQGQMHPTTIHLSPIKEEHEPVQRGIIESEEYVEETLSLDDMERMAILRALERHRGKRREAAKELNISERTLYRKIKEYGLD